VAIPESELQTWILEQDQRRGFKPGKKEGQPNATESNWGGKIHPADLYVIRMERRHDQPIDVHYVKQEQHAG
jgi:hypothetical protein